MNVKLLVKLLEKKGAKAEVIRKTGLSRPTIDSIVSGGDFRMSNFERICDALNVSPCIFFDGSNGDAITSNGERSLTAREIGTATLNNGDTIKVEEKVDEKVVENNCPDADKQTVEALRAENNLLKTLLAEKTERIQDLRTMLDNLRR